MFNKSAVTGWIREHKTELIIAGVSVAAIALTAVCYRNRRHLVSAFEAFHEFIGKNIMLSESGKILSFPTNAKAVSAIEPVSATSGSVRMEVRTLQKMQDGNDIIVSEAVTEMVSQKVSIPCHVKGHARKLPEGWHASEGKLEQAAKNGVTLEPGQTWVVEHDRGGCAA